MATTMSINRQCTTAADGLIPVAPTTYEAWQRAEHHDLADLDPARAWAELQLLRVHLSRLVWCRARRLQVVRVTRAGDVVNERDWCIERIDKLERRLAQRRRAA